MNYKILLIDDDRLTNYINRTILNRHLPGVDIVEFSDPEKALHYLDLNALRDDMEWLILLDINMPRISGWDILDAINLKYPEMNGMVVLLTSSIDKTDRDKAYTYEQVISFVSKPLERKKISGILDAMAGYKGLKRLEA